MSKTKTYKITWFIYWRWALTVLALVILFPLVVPIVEFPLLLLAAIVSRIFGNPEFAGSIPGVVQSLISQPLVYGPIVFAISFFVLRAVLSTAIGREFDGKILVLQDAPKPAQ